MRWKKFVRFLFIVLAILVASCVHVDEHRSSETVEDVTDTESDEMDEIERLLRHAPFHSNVREVHAWELEIGSSFLSIDPADSVTMYAYERATHEGMADFKTVVMYVFLEIEQFDLGAMFVVFFIEGSRAYSSIASHFLSVVGPPDNGSGRTLNWKLPSGVTVSLLEQPADSPFGTSVALVGLSTLPIPILDLMQ